MNTLMEQFTYQMLFTDKVQRSAGFLFDKGDGCAACERRQASDATEVLMHINEYGQHAKLHI